MRRFRRVAPFVANVLALQFFVGASELTCGLPMRGQDRTATAGSEQSSMPDDMPGMPMPSRSNGPRNSGSEQTPCNIPWAPTGCAATAPCAAGGMAACAVTLAQLAPLPGTALAATVLPPVTRTTAPEPPPPKA